MIRERSSAVTVSYFLLLGSEQTSFLHHRRPPNFVADSCQLLLPPLPQPPPAAPSCCCCCCCCFGRSSRGCSCRLRFLRLQRSLTLHIHSVKSCCLLHLSPQYFYPIYQEVFHPWQQRVNSSGSVSSLDAQASLGSPTRSAHDMRKRHRCKVTGGLADKACCRGLR